MKSTTPDTLPPWSKQQTIDLLTADPLPSSFRWPHKDGGDRPVVPSHKNISGGYGKWLNEGPQFPSLFELINDILADVDGCTTHPAWLAADELRAPTAKFESWSTFLVIELQALKRRYAEALTSAEPLATQLRRLRARPTTPADLF